MCPLRRIFSISEGDLQTIAISNYAFPRVLNHKSARLPASIGRSPLIDYQPPLLR